MTRILAAALASAAIVTAADGKPEFKDNRDRASYSVGFRYGTSWKQQGFEIDPALFAQGLKDAYAGKGSLTEEELASAMSAYQQEVRAKAEAKRAEEGTKNKAEADKFLAANKTKEGVKTTESGLQYKVLKEGSGATPKDGDTVVTHYRGRLLDGTEFDSSYKRNEPASFNINAVIRGWTEALKLMKVGSKLELYIPPDLAYGERGFGQSIPPNAALIFEIELVEVKEGAAPKAEPVTSDIIKVPSAEELKKGAKIEVIKPDQVKQYQNEAQKNK